jgi:fucose permease
MARMPDVRSDLSLGNGTLGSLLLVFAVGAVVGTPTAGRLIQIAGEVVVVRVGAVLCCAGLVAVAFGAAVLNAAGLVAVGLFTYGVGTGIWDVAMNVAGSQVERRSQRTLMTQFHGTWGIGAVTGAGVGALAAGFHVPMEVHASAVALIGLLSVLRSTGAYPAAHDGSSSNAPVRTAWREPRTLALGVMVIAFGAVEGSANDWLSLSLIDGYGVSHGVGVAGYALFSLAMTAGRFLVSPVLDRVGRPPVLWASAICVAAGVLLVVFGEFGIAIVAGTALWGLGAAAGFPVGISAGADELDRAPARVSVIATMGDTSFIAGPPLLGMLADRVGTLYSLLAVAALMVPAAVTVLAARPARSAAF